MNYAVIGLGHFGFHVVKGLAHQGNSVIAIDSNHEKVKEASAITDHAMQLNSTDTEALEQAGVAGIDVVVVSLGSSTEASILTVMALKDLQNKIIIAKAKDLLHGEILAKVGATRVIYPEREMAKKLVKNISTRIILETIDISNSLKGVKFIAPKGFIGKKVKEINLEKYSVKVSAIKTDDIWEVDKLDLEIGEKTVLFVIGKRKEIQNFIDSELN